MSKTSFSWKRKRCKNVWNSRPATFTEDDDDDDETAIEDWRSLTKKCNHGVLEDRITKSNRLKNEGIALAELQRYWESIKKWNEAIQLTPDHDVLHEMKAQVLLELDEIFPAIQAAEMAVSLKPQSPHSLQTLGRAQIAIGEIQMAIISFSKAVHIKPDFEEIYTEDLRWAMDLRKESVKRQKNSESTCQDNHDHPPKETRIN